MKKSLEIISFLTKYYCTTAQKTVISRAIILLSLFLSLTVISQEQNKLALKYIGLEQGIYKAIGADNSGYEGNLMVGFKQNKNIYELNIGFGIIGDFAEQTDDLLEEIGEIFLPKFVIASLLYGREFPIYKDLSIAGYAGVSYVYGADQVISTIGLPMKGRFLYSIYNYMDLGVGSTYIISHIDNKLSFDISVIYKL